MSVTQSFFNRQPGSSIPIQHRGLAYGDGLFETMRFTQGQCPLWSGHLARLQRGAEALKLKSVATLDRPQAFMEFVQSHLADHERVHWVKLIVLRGNEGSRAYRPGPEAGSDEILIIRPYQPPEWVASPGVAARTLGYRLAPQVCIGGLKHLNRLPQVLGSMALEPDEAEGILLDIHGNVIEGTLSNILYRLNGRWYTPDLHDAGVSGVLRNAMLAASSAISASNQSALSMENGLQVRSLPSGELDLVESMAFCNSVFGVVPITHLDGRPLKDQAAAQSLRDRVNRWLDSLLLLPNQAAASDSRVST